MIPLPAGTPRSESATPYPVRWIRAAIPLMALMLLAGTFGIGASNAHPAKPAPDAPDPYRRGSRGRAPNPAAVPRHRGRRAEPVPGARLREQAARRPPGGLGYLLKERVSDIALLVDALQRVHDGECVLDPTIVARIMRDQRPSSGVGRLSRREREILMLMAEGRSNASIASALFLSERTVEAATTQVFRKLGIEASPDVNRRVVAVLTVLRSAG